MKISLYHLAAVIPLFLLGASPSQAQTIVTTYPASLCDTSNIRDDNSMNPHISKGTIAILGISDGVSNPLNTTSVVYCPITRRAPDRNGRVRIDLFVKRFGDSGGDPGLGPLEFINCSFVHTTEMGMPVDIVSDLNPEIAGLNPDQDLILTGDFPSSRPNGVFGVSCEFEGIFDVTLYSLRVQEYGGRRFPIIIGPPEIIMPPGPPVIILPPGGTK